MSVSWDLSSNTHSSSKMAELRRKGTSSMVRRLAKITKNITQVIANRETKKSEINSLGEVFKRVATAKPHTYHGKEDPSSLKYWIWWFDKLFDAIVCLENLRVNNIVYHLRDGIDIWCKQRKMIDLLEDLGFGWNKFKDASGTKFYPSSSRKKKTIEFINMRMGTMSVNEYYYSKFLELMRFAHEIVPYETLKLQRFKQGLTLTL